VLKQLQSTYTSTLQYVVTIKHSIKSYYQIKNVTSSTVLCSLKYNAATHYDMH